jgi:hypothetical protein
LGRLNKIQRHGSYGDCLFSLARYGLNIEKTGSPLMEESSELHPLERE